MSFVEGTGETNVLVLLRIVVFFPLEKYGENVPRPGNRTHRQNQFIDRVRPPRSRDTWHYYAYVRVSRSREVRLGYGNAQLMDIVNVVQESGDGVIKDVRMDLGVSVKVGHEQHQAGLAELVGIINDDPHPKKVLIVTDASRVARSRALGSRWFTDILVAGAVIEVAGERRYRNVESDHRDWVEVCERAEIANYNQGNGTANGIAMRRLNGLPPGQYPYALDRDAGGGLAFVRHLSPLVLRLFESAKRGATWEQLVGIADDDDYWFRYYTTMTLEVSRDALQRMLRNPIYAGLIRVGDDPEIVTPTRFDSLISIDDFVEVQHQLPPRTPPRREEFPLWDWLVCGTCGKQMRWSSVRLTSPLDDTFAWSDKYTCGVNGCRPKKLVDRNSIHSQIDAVVPYAARVRRDMDLATTWLHGNLVDQHSVIRELFPNRLRVVDGQVRFPVRVGRVQSSVHFDGTIEHGQ